MTCWDGSYAHKQSECPACTNKPTKIPCGQTWDETTCKLKGTAKTCSDGFTLNTSTCQCENLQEEEVLVIRPALTAILLMRTVAVVTVHVRAATAIR